KQYAAEGDFKHKDERVTVKLTVLEFQDGGVHIYYAPALDLSGYGKSEKEARKSFDFVMEEFMAYTLKKGTLHKELRRLGWNLRKFLEKEGLHSSGIVGGHEKWTRKDLFRPIIIQTHVDPVPEFIVKQILRNLKISREEFLKRIE